MHTVFLYTTKKGATTTTKKTTACSTLNIPSIVSCILASETVIKKYILEFMKHGVLFIIHFTFKCLVVRGYNLYYNSPLQ